MWKIVILMINLNGEIQQQWEYKKYIEADRWRCHARAVRMNDKGKDSGYYAVCIKDLLS